MLASAETVRIIADALQRHRVPTIIVDPVRLSPPCFQFNAVWSSTIDTVKVMVATSGAQLLPGDAVKNLRDLLLPMTSLLTPNIPEATLLLRDADIQYKSPSSLEDLKALAKMVHSLGPKAILLKGGHMPLTKEYVKGETEEEKSITVDILYDGNDYTIIESRYLSSKNTHGTGCSLASAIASNIALQKSASQPYDLATATRLAVRYVSAGIVTAHASLGKGSGPINHFHSMQTLPFSPGYFIEYLLSHPSVAPTWQKYTHHDFATQMARGTLPEDLFKSYLIQDYLYLTHFARTHALAAYKSKTMDAITASATIIMHIEREMELHLGYCREFGISKAEIEDPTRRESLACVAYSRYVLDVGQSEDWLALQMALAPCLLGYGQAAQRLYREKESVKTEQGNRYWRWVENYVAEDYQQAVRVGSQLIEKNIIRQSPQRVEELVRIFVRATEMEVRFWDFDAHS